MMGKYMHKKCSSINRLNQISNHDALVLIDKGRQQEVNVVSAVLMMSTISPAQDQ